MPFVNIVSSFKDCIIYNSSNIFSKGVCFLIIVVVIIFTNISPLINYNFKLKSLRLIYNVKQ